MFLELSTIPKKALTFFAVVILLLIAVQIAQVDAANQTFYVDDNNCTALTSTPSPTVTITPTLTVTPTGTLTPTISPTVTGNTTISPTVSPTGTQFGTKQNPFCTITQAVNAATNNDTIIVAAGNYPESVNVNKTLQLYGAQRNNDARTRSKPVNQESVVGTATGAFQVTADNVTIQGFMIQGVNSGLGAGVHTTSGNSGLRLIYNIIQNNTIGLYLNSNGDDMMVVNRNLFRNNNQPGSATGTGIYSDQGLEDSNITRNRFVNHNNASIIISGVAPSVTPTVSPTVTITLTPTITPTGTLTPTVSPTGNVTISPTTTLTPTPAVNTINKAILISRNESTDQSIFLILYSTGNSEVSRNTATNFKNVSNVDPNLALQGSGIYLGGGNQNVVITRNEINGAAFSGINIVDDGSGFGPNRNVEVSRNESHNSGDHGIKVGSFGAGGTTALIGGTLSRNDTDNNTLDGIFIQTPNTGLLISRNNMEDNTEHDAHDNNTASGGTAGTGNTWERNNCETDQPNGLCED